MADEQPDDAIDVAQELNLPERIVLHGGGEHPGLTLPQGLYLAHGSYEALRYPGGHVEILGLALPTANVTQDAPNVSATVASVPESVVLTPSTHTAPEPSVELPPTSDGPVDAPEGAEGVTGDTAPLSAPEGAEASQEALSASGDGSEAAEPAA